MNFPSAEQVESATRVQLAWWLRFLEAESDEEIARVLRMWKRFADLGGWSPEVSKQIRWDGKPLKEI